MNTIEQSSNPCQLGTCIKCGNPSQDPTQEHFVVATASEGVSPPEVSKPQRVEAPHQFSQPANMVDRIADILVEDHIALMKEVEQLRNSYKLGFNAGLEAAAKHLDTVEAKYAAKWEETTSSYYEGYRDCADVSAGQIRELVK